MDRSFKVETTVRPVFNRPLNEWYIDEEDHELLLNNIFEAIKQQFPNGFICEERHHKRIEPSCQLCERFAFYHAYYDNTDQTWRTLSSLDDEEYYNNFYKNQLLASGSFKMETTNGVFDLTIYAITV